MSISTGTKASLLALAAFWTVSTAAALEPQSAPQGSACHLMFDPASSLRARVAPPSERILSIYVESGAGDVKTHQLTDKEWVAVDAAIDALPRLHRQILQQHLRHISFVDTASGAGNALTSIVETECGKGLYDITLRAGLLREDLTQFLNGKEAGVFAQDGSGYSVHLEAGNMASLNYILLHEGTHVVDAVLGLAADDANPLRAGIWKRGERRALLPPYDDSPINDVLWRSGKKIPFALAIGVYQGLSASPFVSLYASGAVSEDIADTVAWQQLSRRFGVKLEVQVRDPDGTITYRYEPLKSPLVRRRFKVVEALLSRRSKY